MKRIYIPNKDILLEMQDREANVYKYMLTKTVESIMRCGVKYPDLGMFKFAGKNIREDLEIARAICTLYPREMKYSKVAREDLELCLRLIQNGFDSDNRLNYLGNFLASVQTNPIVVKKTILLLEEELKKNPRYRFEFNGYNFDYYVGDYSLLNDVFAGTVANERLEGIIGPDREEVVKALVNIEPAYAITLPINNFTSGQYNNDEDVRNEYLHTGIENYANRYGISPNVGIEYFGEDILRKPNDQVKKLMRCMEKERFRD